MTPAGDESDQPVNPLTAPDPTAGLTLPAAEPPDDGGQPPANGARRPAAGAGSDPIAAVRHLRADAGEWVAALDARIGQLETGNRRRDISDVLSIVATLCVLGSLALLTRRVIALEQLTAGVVS